MFEPFRLAWFVFRLKRSIRERIEKGAITPVSTQLHEEQGWRIAGKARQVAPIADEMRFDRREMDGQQITAIMWTSNDQTICHMKTDLMMLCRLVVAAALAAMVVTGCGMAKPATPALQPPQVSVVTVRRGSVQITTELPGRTSAYPVAQ